MKRKRMFREDSNGGIATYVLIMFGMAFMLYLFGFYTIFETYMNTAGATSGSSNMSIANPLLNMGVNFIILIITPLNALIAGASIATLVGAFLLFRFLGAQTVFYQYLIPAVILVALNIFIFPLNDIANEMNSFGLITSSFLIGFFNLFYILGVIDFIRGPTG